MSGAVATGLIRRLAERLLGRIILVRTLPTEIGAARIVVSARVGGLKYLFKGPRQWDPELLRVAGELVRPADCVWDVGANVGLFAMAARHHSGPGGKVVAMEADHDAVSLLFATARHGGDGLTVLPVAVSHEDGFVRFAIAKRARAANAIEGFGSTQTGGVLETRTLPSRSLDSLMEHFPAPNVLKIDVEGAELAVLRGASRLLAHSRPRIYCEVTAQTCADVTHLLHGFGYRTFDGESYGTAHPSAVRPGTTNMVAIHSSEEERQRSGS